jgi:hypothetical protein
MFVYPGTVDAAVMVAVVIALIAEEEVKTPPVVIVPAVVGETVQLTSWLGLLAPATVAAKERLFPAVTVPVPGATVTEVTVVVVPPPVLPVEGFVPQPAMERMVKTTHRQNLGAKANAAKVLRMVFLLFDFIFSCEADAHDRQAGFRLPIIPLL